MKVRMFGLFVKLIILNFGKYLKINFEFSLYTTQLQLVFHFVVFMSKSFSLKILSYFRYVQKLIQILNSH